MVPRLVDAWAALPGADPLRARLEGPVRLLRDWDARWSAASEPTTLAVFWAEELWTLAGRRRPQHGNLWEATAALSPRDKIDAFESAVARLEREWGGWRVPWGEVNRFQRLDDVITDQAFHDDRASIPIPFAQSRWGTLASFASRTYPGTRRWYGTSGNSFVAIVEFGPRIRAWAVTAGGESGHPGDRHFNDEAERYAGGNLRPVYFYDTDLAGHTERSYHPGSR